MNISFPDYSEWAFFLFLWSLTMCLDLSPWIPMSVHTVEENYNPIPLLDQISLKNGDSRCRLWWSWQLSQQQKRLLSLALAKSLIPTQTSLYSDALQCHGLLLLHQSNKTRCMSMHHGCSILHKISEFSFSWSVFWQRHDVDRP